MKCFTLRPCVFADVVDKINTAVMRLQVAERALSKAVTLTKLVAGEDLKRLGREF